MKNALVMLVAAEDILFELDASGKREVLEAVGRVFERELALLYTGRPHDA